MAFRQQGQLHVVVKQVGKKPYLMRGATERKEVKTAWFI